MFHVKHSRRSFFVNPSRLYSECWGNPAMAINGRRNKPFGPGGSTRRLHPSPPPCLPLLAGGSREGVSAGAKQDRRGRKGRAFARHGTTDIGPSHSCKRRLCSGCPGCVTQFGIPI